jgi:hypothetical protein
MLSGFSDESETAAAYMPYLQSLYGMRSRTNLHTRKDDLEDAERFFSFFSDIVNTMLYDEAFLNIIDECSVLFFAGQKKQPKIGGCYPTARCSNGEQYG